ncbi:MAG: carbon starvation CstA family protein [Eubacterium ventriosum]
MKQTKQGLVTQPQIFAGAIANFLSVAGLPHQLVFTLINLAVSAFALTSLDSVARVGRLSFQEFFIDDDTDMDNLNPFMKVVTNKYFATILTLVLSYLLAKVGYAEIWPLFGSANQLLSVLALVACAVFLKKTKRQGCYALDSNVLYDGSNIYSTWNDNLQIRWSVIYNRINIWYDITVNLCSIVIMPWCNCSNPGCKEAFRKVR